VAECRLTSLCLQYLTFENFDLDIKPERLQSLTCQGYLVFQDYAIANWFYHLGAMVKGADELLGPLSEAQAALRELDVALQDFAGYYEDDITDNDQVEDKLSEAFSGCDFYPVLKMVMGHVSRHKEKVSLFYTSQLVPQQFKKPCHISCLWFRDVFLNAKFRNDRDSKPKMT
jgi:hypothetical protein